MALLSLICLAHNNIQYKNSFEDNVHKFNDMLSNQGDSLEVIYATSGAERIITNDGFTDVMFTEFYDSTIDMVEKIRISLSLAKGEICFFMDN